MPCLAFVRMVQAACPRFFAAILLCRATQNARQDEADPALAPTSVCTLPPPMLPMNQPGHVLCKHLLDKSVCARVC